MTGRCLPAGRHGVDDVAIGDWIETATATITADMIDQFAALSGDHFEIHMQDSAAKAHGFKGRVAHGLLILSIVDGLKNQTDAQFKAQASLGWDWSFRAPVFLGDEISARLSVMEKTTISDPARGILTIGFEVKNQRRELVQEGQNRLMAYR